MKILEIIQSENQNITGIELDDDEIAKIRQDKEIKQRPKVRNMMFTVMPGNDSTEPAF
jgi:hypothetical protein